MSTGRVWPLLGSGAVVLLAIAIGALPPVAAVAAWIDARAWPLLIGVGALLAAGFALFFIGILELIMDRGEPLTHAEAEDVACSVHVAARPGTARASTYRLRGAAAGARGAEKFKLGELKAALRSGAAWRDPLWRRRLVTTVGALLLLVGICGAFVVIGPPWIKVLLGGALLYAFGRLGYGFWRT